MQIYRSLKQIDVHGPSWLSVGTFDGVHVGHRAILGRLIERARQGHGKSVLVTFEQHPQNVINSSKPPVSILTPIEEKTALLESIGVDATVILPFTEALARVRPEIFIEDLTQHFQIHGMVSGSSHVFGSGRSGNAGLLETLGKRLGFATEIVPPVLIHGETVSSTGIRNLLLDGRLAKANRFLGSYYSITGRVVLGDHIGMRLGFPTANLQPENEHKLIPRNGVYAVFVRIGGKTALGTANIGVRPTMATGDQRIEVHIHGESENLYGRQITIEFMHRLRDEKKYDSVEALTEQIKRDTEKTQRLLSKDHTRA